LRLFWESSRHRGDKPNAYCAKSIYRDGLRLFKRLSVGVVCKHDELSGKTERDLTRNQLYRMLTRGRVAFGLPDKDAFSAAITKSLSISDCGESDFSFFFAIWSE
jgi:hypothetical protein